MPASLGRSPIFTRDDALVRPILAFHVPSRRKRAEGARQPRAAEASRVTSVSCIVGDHEHTVWSIAPQDLLRAACWRAVFRPHVPQSSGCPPRAVRKPGARPSIAHRCRARRRLLGRLTKMKRGLVLAAVVVAMSVSVAYPTEAKAD